MCASIGVDPLASNKVGTCLLSWGCRSAIQVKMSMAEKEMYEMCTPFEYTTVDIQMSVLPQGFWSNMLDIGDFYYELGVQIVEVKLEDMTIQCSCS